MSRPIGEKIAAIARRERGNKACGPNKVDGGDYCNSCKNHHAAEPWCADFAKWVWIQAKALHTDKLDAGAASFARYGTVRQHNPRVGDAVLFGYDGVGFAKHVAIVVRVLPGGKIVSIGGNEGPSDDTSVVSRDGPYSGGFDTWDPLAPNGPISGYVSPVEDDMPFTKNEIRNLVQEGVAAAVKTDRPTQKEIVNLVKQAVQAELTTDTTLAEISKQLKALAEQVAALTPATSAATGDGLGTGTGTGQGDGTGTSGGTGTSSAAGASGPATGQPS